MAARLRQFQVELLIGHWLCLIFWCGGGLIVCDICQSVNRYKRVAMWQESCYFPRAGHWVCVWHRSSWWGPMCQHYYLSRCEHNVLQWFAVTGSSQMASGTCLGSMYSPNSWTLLVLTPSLWITIHFRWKWVQLISQRTTVSIRNWNIPINDHSWICGWVTVKRKHKNP